jgi:hypothetical protein
MQGAEDSLQFHVAGLTVEQARRYALPENFERPGQWQWEALSDVQAREIIEGALKQRLDLEALGDAIERAGHLRSAWINGARSRCRFKIEMNSAIDEKRAAGLCGFLFQSNPFGLRIIIDEQSVTSRYGRFPQNIRWNGNPD